MNNDTLYDIIQIIGGSVIDDDVIKKANSLYGDEDVRVARSIRDNIRNEMWIKIEASNKGWKGDDLEREFQAMMTSNYPEYSFYKMRPILGFIGWMCWHEGYLAT